MANLRYTDGNVTVALTGELEAFVRRALETAQGETVRIMEAAAEDIAAKARAEWYDPDANVTRRTGKSGQIEVVTTVSDTEVRVSVGSTDLSKAKFVRRPGRLSTVAVEISAAEYNRAQAAGGASAKLVFRARTARPDAGVEAGKYYRIEGNPRAGDGRFLLAELIRKPMTLKIRTITPELGRAIAARAGRV